MGSRGARCSQHGVEIAARPAHRRSDQARCQNRQRQGHAVPHALVAVVQIRRLIAARCDDGHAGAGTPAMSALLGQQLVMDNRGGAGGRIAAETVFTAAPDGYTLFMASSPSLTIVPHISKVPYNTLK